jgi:hypothetical protein
MITLNESFDEVRASCPYREYYQKYTNYEYVENGKELGKFGKDYGHIKCLHPQSRTGWCRDDIKASRCPRVVKEK